MAKTEPSLLEIAHNPLMQAMRRVIRAAEHSRLAPEKLSRISPDLAVIARVLELTTTQALLFALFVELSDNRRIHLRELCGYVGCRRIDLVAMMSDIEVLRHRQLIRVRSHEETTYRVPDRVLHAIMHGRNYTPEPLEGLTTEVFFQQAERQFHYHRQWELSSEELVETLQQLLDSNRQLAFCRVLRGYKFPDPLATAVVMLLAVWLAEEIRQIAVEQLLRAFGDSRSIHILRSGLRTGNYCLFEKGLIEYGYASGLADRNCIRLTRAACEKLFTEIDISFEENSLAGRKELLPHAEIPAKELFYNEREGSQITILAGLLEQEHFAGVYERLQGSGLRTGFAVLFYGAPGTGKTETVYQLARQTGRDILEVNIAQTRSMWFGESEKLIKGIFDNYRKAVRESKAAPILLFNEADAVLGKRQQNGNNRLAQTENAMQNMLLQEMERFEGILIATTNLTQNLDKAFERRFLYKIEFRRPEPSVRKAIWQAIMPGLSDEVAGLLAARCDFSGGQIENVARRQTVEQILHGVPLTPEGLLKLCREERIGKEEGSRQPLGFRGAGIRP